MNAKISYINTFLCSLFFITLVATARSHTWAPFALALFSLIFIKSSWSSIKNREVATICISILPYFVLVAISLFLYGGDLSQLDMPSRTVVASLILLYLYRYPPQKKYIFYAIPIGGVVAGLIALYHVNGLDSRAFTVDKYMVIQVAGLCATLGVLSIITFFYSLQKNNKLLSVLAIAGATLAFLACLLSGARGSWVLTPFVSLVVIWIYRKALNKKIVFSFLVISAICITVALPHVIERFQTTSSELTRYSHNNSHSSTGSRLELWKSSIYSFIDKPVFGQGFDGVIQAKQKQFEQGKVKDNVFSYTRAHNQLFEEMQTKGALGAIALIAMFYFPFKVFQRIYTSSSASTESRCFALMGLCHIVLVIGYSLTQHYLNHHSGIVFYVVGIAILASLSLPQPKHKMESIR